MIRRWLRHLRKDLGKPDASDVAIEGVSDASLVVEGQQLSYPDDSEPIEGAIEGISDPPLQIKGDGTVTQ